MSNATASPGSMHHVVGDRGVVGPRVRRLGVRELVDVGDEELAPVRVGRRVDGGLHLVEAAAERADGVDDGVRSELDRILSPRRRRCADREHCPDDDPENCGLPTRPRHERRAFPPSQRTISSLWGRRMAAASTTAGATRGERAYVVPINSIRHRARTAEGQQQHHPLRRCGERHGSRSARRGRARSGGGSLGDTRCRRRPPRWQRSADRHAGERDRLARLLA